MATIDPVVQESSLAHISVILKRQPENVGFVARAVANHGLGPFVLVNPTVFDPERARWSAPGARHIIDGIQIFGTLTEAVSSFEQVFGTTARPRSITQTCWSPHELCTHLLETPRKSAVLFGPEDSGLNRDDLSCCTALIRIPTTKVSSLNLAQAVTALAALLKHEATQKVASSDEPNTWAPMAVQNHLIDEAMELLEWSGYLNGRSEVRVRTTLFQLLARVQEDGSEVGVLRGMLKGMRYRAGLINDSD